ncbi:MAG: glycine betaine ABC transporter substrate-binding protein, partial [Parasphingorhabdus sp.]
TQNWTLVLAGCLFSAALAIAVDLLLGLIERGIRERRRILVGAGLAIIAAGLLTAMLPLMVARDNVVVIGAKGFSEQFILARLIGSRLEEAGYEVRYRDGLGSAVVYQALSEGDIDVYVDYSGTIWTNQMRRTDSQPKSAMLDTIAQWTSTSHGVKMLGALGFENSYAFAVRPEDARSKSLRTLNDLARVSSDFNFGTDVEFLERPEWRMVQAAYPIRFKDARSFSPTFMYPALASGEVDVISAFSSDGRIAANGFVVLEDTKNAVPSYEAILLLAPNRNNDDKFVAALNPLVGAITVEKMREANYMVDREDDKKTPRRAALWLNDKLKE